MTMTKQRKTDRVTLARMSEPPKPQPDKFRDLARELEADEDPAHFEETVRKIAPKDRTPTSADQKAD